MPKSKEAFGAMRESTRQRIEAAAVSLFARRGLSVTVGEIAKTAGLSQGLLYSHYPSKDALIATLARQAMDISGHAIGDVALSDLSADEKIRRITAMMCEMLAHHSPGIDYFMFMVQVNMSGFQLPEAYSADCSNPLESFAGIIAQGQAEGSVVNGSPVQLSTVYWAAIQGLCCYNIAGMAFSPEPETLLRILLCEETNRWASA